MSTSYQFPVRLSEVQVGDRLKVYDTKENYEYTVRADRPGVDGLYICLRGEERANLSYFVKPDGTLRYFAKAVEGSVKPQRSPGTDHDFEEVFLEDINPQDTILSVEQGFFGRQFLVFTAHRDDGGLYYYNNENRNKVYLINYSPYVNTRYYRLNTEVSKSDIKHQSQAQTPSTAQTPEPQCSEEEVCASGCEEIVLSTIEPGQTLAKVCGETEPFPEFTVYEHASGLFFVDTNEEVVFLDDLVDDDEADPVLRGFKRVPTSQTAENGVGQSWWLKAPGVLTYGTSKFEIIVTSTKGFAANWGDVRLQTTWSIEFEDLKRLCEARYLAFCELGLEP